MSEKSQEQTAVHGIMFSKLKKHKFFRGTCARSSVSSQQEITSKEKVNTKSRGVVFSPEAGQKGPRTRSYPDARVPSSAVDS